jgi:hypothetical protein
MNHPVVRPLNVLPHRCRPFRPSTSVMAITARSAKLEASIAITITRTTNRPHVGIRDEDARPCAFAAPALLCEDRAHLPDVTLGDVQEAYRADVAEPTGFLAQVLQRRRNHESFDLVRVSVDERPDLAERCGSKPCQRCSLSKTAGPRQPAVERAIPAHWHMRCRSRQATRCGLPLS